ncbi:ABC transporter ATP-binding protein [Methylocystis parvus]|uniref:ABC transporter ATP-binding protein n=1 Tax=Methylocystis parvus TaxID=134 RepID=A0A6B8MB84_9HYPH|nr:ABC transporter ATP-binding protein [Methylocystis parvus]QGM98553.1 ABC transporter ATP-binding protein [Methylocystis parvus]WBK01107.1 ABC transporter ATP-binding protein [Methylocystis parvus OBBP]
MTAPLLSVSEISKRYGAVVALEGVSLNVGAGEFFALLGPSGCGKTTLMRCIAGFETPDSGKLTLKSADLSGVPPHRRPVNMMFQSYALFPHLNVYENVAFGLRRKGEREEAIRARVSELLDMTQLAPFGARRINELSGGQRQRVALARALAPRPALLLLDEPLGALDRKLREETQFQLKEIQRKTRTSFVIVTHDQDEALAIADRIAVMRTGKVEQIAAPIEIYEKPATRFVAGFVGEMNFIEGEIARDDGAAFVTSFARLPRAECALPQGARATLGLRPERIEVSRDGEGVAGRVEDFVFRGEYTLLRVRVAPDVVLRVGAYDGRFAIGDDVKLTIAPDAGVLFAESE